MASKFLIAVLSQDKIKGLLSSEYFSVEGTLLEAGPGAKSFRPKDGSGEPPVRAEPRADHPRPITLAADKVYDTGDFIMELRERAVTPHVAQNNGRRRSAIDGRTTRHPGYAVSQRIRKRIEEAFG